MELGCKCVLLIFATSEYEKRMKLLFSILPISIAILLITVFSVVPHHHHKEKLCMAVEICKEDNTYNDQHTEHETSQEEANHENGCIVNTLYAVFAAFLNENSSSVDGDNRHSLVQCLCLLVSYILYTPDFLTTKAAYQGYAFPYESACFNLSCGLRAPPFLS